MSLFDIFMKSPNSERTDFCRAMGPKEIDSSFNLQPKSLFRVKNFFQEHVFKNKYSPVNKGIPPGTNCNTSFFVFFYQQWCIGILPKKVYQDPSP